MLIEWKGKAEGSNKRLDTSRQGYIYKNKDYTAFQKSLTYTIIQQNTKHVKYIKHIYVKLYLRISKRRDIDSLIKPVLDCLEMSGIIKNDNEISELHIIKEDKKSVDPDYINISLDGIYE